jgi:hypothetical protein
VTKALTAGESEGGVCPPKAARTKSMKDRIMTLRMLHLILIFARLLPSSIEENHTPQKKVGQAGLSPILAGFSSHRF